MRVIRFQVGRLLVTAAAIQIYLGLSFYAFPVHLFNPVYDPIRSCFPGVAAALMGGGLLLLVMVRHPLPVWRLRGCAMLAAAPLALIAYVMWQANVLTGLIIFGAMSIAILLAPWCGDPMHEEGTRLDLLDLTMGMVFLLISGLMLTWHSSLAAPIFVALEPMVLLVGLSGLLGAAVLLLPMFYSPLQFLQRMPWRLISSWLPLALIFIFFKSDLATGVVAWGIIAVTLIVRGSQPPPQEAPPQSEGPIAPSISLPGMEGLIEVWSWGLALVVVILTALSNMGVVASPLLASIFVLGLSSYNALLYLGLSRVGTTEQRIYRHLVFLVVMIGLLLPGAGPLAPSFMVVLVLVAAATGLALGPRQAFQVALMALVVVVAGEAEAAIATRSSPIIGLAQGVAKVTVLSVAFYLALKTTARQRELVGSVTQMWQELSEMTRALRLSEAKLSGIVDQAHDAIISVDREQRIILFNKSAEGMFGYAAAELLGQPLAILMPEQAARVHSKHVEGFHASEVSSRPMSDRPAVKGRRKSGEEFPMEASISKLVVGTELVLTAIARDVTQRRAAQEQLIHLANYDALTDLPNRRHFQVELTTELNRVREEGGRGALLFLDLDDFKYINDSLGHHAGDQLIAQIGRVLRDLLSQRDLVARLGGDEFALVLPGADAAAALKQAEIILQTLRDKTMLLHGQPITITGSVGIALYPAHGTALEDLLTRADMAMYRAKQDGRNAIWVHREDDNRRAMLAAKVTWEARIRDALTHDRFVLHFQPIMNLATGVVFAHEALLRLPDEHGRLILPGEFLAVAERYGLIREIDRWVVCRAIDLIVQYHEKGQRLRLQVNLSGRALTDAELLSRICDRFQSTGVDPTCLVIEVTETAAITDIKQAQCFVERLRSWGCGFAIDDFGAGLSSFNYLKHLPFDYLKIDGAFIQNLARNPVDRHLVRAMVDVARSLGKLTVAEFVEDEATLEVLREIGVHYVQGYHLGRPGPLAIKA